MEWRRFLSGLVRALPKGATPSARTNGESRPSFLETELMNDLRGKGGLSAEGETLTAGLFTADLSVLVSISLSLIFNFTSSNFRSSFSLRRVESSFETG